MDRDINELKPNYRPRTNWLIDEHGDPRLLPSVPCARPHARTGLRMLKLTEIHTAETVLLTVIK